MQIIITIDHVILGLKLAGALLAGGLTYWLLAWWENNKDHQDYERRSAEYQSFVKSLHGSHNELVGKYEELRLELLDLKEENRTLSKRNEFLTNELTIDRKRTQVMKIPTASGTIQLMDEDLIVDSPNYVSPSMEALAARGYKRVNR